MPVKTAFDLTARWQPLFEGPEATPLFEVIHEIATRVDPANHSSQDPSLGRGKAGVALLYAYLVNAGGGAQYREGALRCLDDLMIALAEQPMEPSLYGGITGVGWVAQHLSHRLEEAPENINDQIDDVILSSVQRPPWGGPFDLICGLVGYGVYAIERLPGSMAEDCVRAICDRLAEIARREATGLAWWSLPQFLGPWKEPRFPGGCFDLGMAHGAPGVIGFLATTLAAGAHSSRARELLEGAVKWLLSQELPLVKDCSRFSFVLGPEGSERRSNRLSWCYGDPGVAASLLWAGRAFGSAAWEERALEIARDCAARPPEHAGIVHVGLCHGAAGLGHFFNRMAQATGDDILYGAARFWLRQSMNMLNDEVLNDRAFLEGATGIALALLAAVTSLEPEWDRVLMLSLPHPISSRQKYRPIAQASGGGHGAGVKSRGR